MENAFQVMNANPPFTSFLSLIEKVEYYSKRKEGSHALYTIVGQKADFMMMILRPTMEELNEIETEFNKTKLAEFTIPAHSYVSVVELSNYLPADRGSLSKSTNSSSTLSEFAKNKLCLLLSNGQTPPRK